MSFDLRDCTFFGPALPEPFVKFQLEGELTKRKLLPKQRAGEGRQVQERWEVYRRKLRALGEQGGDRRVASHVLQPLTERLGYDTYTKGLSRKKCVAPRAPVAVRGKAPGSRNSSAISGFWQRSHGPPPGAECNIYFWTSPRQGDVITQEGPEDGGWLMSTNDGRALRAWSVGTGIHPLKLLAEAWSGGVMIGDQCDDEGYQILADSVAKGKNISVLIEARPRLQKMVTVGMEGVPFELIFPEVFHPDGVEIKGFDAVMGNPPWDAIQPYSKEFFATFDLRVLDAPTRRERTEVEQRLEKDPEVARSWSEYSTKFDVAKCITSRLTIHVGKQANGRSSGAISDVWQVFAEHGTSLLRSAGRVGYVMPSAFHANQSATGLRQFYIENMTLQCCFSFENRKKLFDIDSRFKFAAIVAQANQSGTDEFECGFYWHDLEQLFDSKGRLRYSTAFVRRTGANYFTFLELRSQIDADVADTMYRTSLLMKQFLDQARIRCGEEIHMAKGAYRFTPSESVVAPHIDPRDSNISMKLRAKGYLPLHEGKTFHQYNDLWEVPPRYLVAIDALSDKPAWLRAARYYRLAFRAIASSTNERTSIFCLLPPGIICGNSSPIEREPWWRPNSALMTTCSVANSYSFDWILRQKASANVNLFTLNGCPFINFDTLPERFLAHSALRLTCNHAGYAPLWVEQLGDAWREPKPKYTWAVLEGDDERWAVRAAIDAVVADAYGLDRTQYEHVLSTFSHKSYPKASELCLAAFDELKEIGLEAFAKKHDPYWDIPLNENLPEPVIDLPIPSEENVSEDEGGPAFDETGQGMLFNKIRAGTASEVASPSTTPSPKKTTISRAVPQDSQDDVYETLVRLLESKGIITSRDAQEATGLDAAGVRPHLKRLVEEGRAVTEGQRRGMKYRKVSDA